MESSTSVKGSASPILGRTPSPPTQSVPLDHEQLENDILGVSNHHPLPSEGHQDSPADDANSDEARPPPRRLKGIPITPESLNTVDQIILDMKQQRCTDRSIADKLRARGLANYCDKTISTRHIRIRKRLAEYRDEEYDKGNTVWDPANDSALLECIIKVRQDIGKIQAKVEAKMWTMVAEKLQKMDSPVIVPSKACYQRHKSIISGLVSTYPEFKDIDLDHDIASLYDNLVQSRHEHRETELAADLKALRTAECHREAFQVHTKPSLLAISHTRDEDELSETDSAKRSTGDTDTKTADELSQVPCAASPEDRHGDIEQQLASMQLPSPTVMNRKELLAEMSVRGYQAHGTLNVIRANILLARKGKTDLPRSESPGDITEFKKMIVEKERWEIDSDETIEEDSALIESGKNVIITRPRIALQGITDSNHALKRPLEDSHPGPRKKVLTLTNKNRPIKKSCLKAPVLDVESARQASEEAEIKEVCDEAIEYLEQPE